MRKVPLTERVRAWLATRPPLPAGAPGPCHDLEHVVAGDGATERPRLHTKGDALSSPRPTLS